MKKKSQHYIPKFYLKYFSDPNNKDNKIWVFERDKPFKPYLIHPKRVACEPDFYSLSDNDEKLRILIENEFEKLESRTAQIINNIITSKSITLTIEERAVLSGQRQSQKQPKHGITYKICLAISILIAYNCPYGQEQSKAGQD